MTTKILWVGRHEPDNVQLDELKNVFGDFEIDRYDKYVRKVKDVIKKAKGYDVVVTILPASFDIDLIGNGIFPVKSVRMNGAHVEFRVLNEVIVKSTSLKDYYGEGYCEICGGVFPNSVLRARDGLCEKCNDWVEQAEAEAEIKGR